MFAVDLRMVNVERLRGIIEQKDSIKIRVLKKRLKAARKQVAEINKLLAKYDKKP